eukprot:g2620.t1
MRNFAAFLTDFIGRMPCTSSPAVEFGCLNASKKNKKLTSAMLPRGRCPLASCSQLRIFYQPLMHGGDEDDMQMGDWRGELRTALLQARPADWVVGQGLLHMLSPLEVKDAKRGITREGSRYSAVVEELLNVSKAAAPTVLWMTTHKRNTQHVPAQYLETQSNEVLASWNQAAVTVARRLGVGVVDVEDATAGLLDETADGTHFYGIVQEIMADRLLRAICDATAPGGSRRSGCPRPAMSRLHERTLSEQSRLAAAAGAKLTSASPKRMARAVQLQTCLKCFAPCPMAALPPILPDLQILRRFHKHDADNNGVLNTREFRSAVDGCELSIPLSDEQRTWFFTNMSNSKGTIDLKAFVRVYDRAWAYDRLAAASDAADAEVEAAFVHADGGGRGPLRAEPRGALQAEPEFEAALAHLMARRPGGMDAVRRHRHLARLMFVFDPRRIVPRTCWRGFFVGLRAHAARGGGGGRRHG